MVNSRAKLLTLVTQESTITSDKSITSTSYVDSGLTLTMPTKDGYAIILFEGHSLATGGGLNSTYVISDGGTLLKAKEDSFVVNAKLQHNDSAIVLMTGQIVKVQMKTNGQTLVLQGTTTGKLQATLKSLEFQQL